MQPISFPFNANHMFKMNGNLTRIICNIAFLWSHGTILNRGCRRGALQRDNVIVSKEKWCQARSGFWQIKLEYESSLLTGCRLESPPLLMSLRVPLKSFLLGISVQ